MRDFVYSQLPGRIIFGSGTLSTIGDELDAIGAERVMLVAATSAKADADRVVAELGERVVARIGEIRPHVPTEEVETARSLAASSAADSVVTIGGGSTIGLGKAVVLERPLAFLAVPTTYAGSEMTPIYGITSGYVKRTGRDVRVKPGIVIYDVDLTLDLPPEITAGSTMNALAHCVEAMYAKERNPIVSMMALDGVRALSNGSSAVSVNAEDRDGRADLFYGAFLAGASLGAVGMAVHHRICHVLGGTFRLAHGDANAVVLPYVAAYNRRAEPQVIDSIAGALEADDLWLALRGLAMKMRAPMSLSELGIEETDLDRAAEMVVAAGGYNPRPVEKGWIRQLLGDAFEGRKPSEQ